MTVYDKYRNLYILDNILDSKIIMVKIDINKYLILYEFAMNALSKHDIEYIFDPDFHDHKKDLSLIYSDKYYKNINIVFDKNINKIIKIQKKMIDICGKDIKINYDKLCKIYNIYNNIKLYNLDYNILMDKEDFYSKLYHIIHLLINFDLITDVKLLILKIYLIIMRQPCLLQRQHR